MNFLRAMNLAKSLSFPVFWAVLFSGWGKLFCVIEIYWNCVTTSTQEKEKKGKKKLLSIYFFIYFFFHLYFSIIFYYFEIYSLCIHALIFLFIYLLCFISLQRALSEEASHIARTDSSFIVWSKSCYCIILMYHGYYFANVKNQAKCI